MVTLHKSKGRKESGEYLIEGRRFVNEAFLRKAPIKRIFYSKSNNHQGANEACYADISKLVKQALDLKIQVEEVTDIVMKKMSATEEPQGILAIIQHQEFSWRDFKIDQNTIVLIVDGIKDPGNLGTILRTALAADVKQIILTQGTVDLYNPKVLRSSMGSIFSQVILSEMAPHAIVNFCKKHNMSLTVSTMEGHSIFAEGTRVLYPLALVIGNEAIGPSTLIKENAQQKYSIPMFNNVESLNAAMAAGIFLFELRRQLGFL